jgi:hypothetical protein
MLIGRILAAEKCLMRSSPLYRETRVPGAFSALICHTIQDLSKRLKNCEVLLQVMAKVALDKDFFGVEFG